eukprot:CAMPEP_0184973250 /NCGR_PEP_ID=MMETSP1098-20130426/5123_1 /TAXON_ID=89044 /ORGANISM="Spumella elongata, Strain CCAP 955/1" /LENGTH=292 /DNA_ID=CAMNT_0027495695 /DNA_START=25 /DNA_END=903 /DNA_ORIENTATION=-
MPSRHSKNTGSRSHFTHNEKAKANGNVKQRIGSESQLAFGYCALSLHPAENPVVSPSGRVYSREFILEYLLTKGKELKKQWKDYEEQQAKAVRDEETKAEESRSESITRFVETHDGVKSTLKRKVGEDGSSVTFGQAPSRAKFIDDTTNDEKKAQLSHSSPWVPQFIPHARDATLVEPPKRPPSPFSGRPLRSKDLIPIDLIKEADSTAGSVVKYLCPVSRKTITNQKVILIKTTGAMMIEQAAIDLAYPTMTCPLTGKRFSKDDVVELKAAHSGLTARGGVEGKLHRPSMN